MHTCTHTHNCLVLDPVSASARIMFNSKAGQVLSIPQVKVQLSVEEVDVNLDKLQVQQASRGTASLTQ